MEANESTPLVDSIQKPVRTHGDIEAGYTIRRYTSDSLFTELGCRNKCLVFCTATLAIVIFVIIIDMSITALRIAVPAPPFKHPD